MLLAFLSSILNVISKIIKIPTDGQLSLSFLPKKMEDVGENQIVSEFHVQIYKARKSVNETQ